MSEHDVPRESQDLLRRLARHDERSLRTVLAPGPEFADAAFADGDARTAQCLDRTTRGLVRLAALLAIGASTESLRWAVDLASASGADDEAVTSVLIAAGLAAGSAQLVESAPRLALALGVELEPVEDVLWPYWPSRPASNARATASDLDAAPSFRYTACACVLTVLADTPS